MSTNIDTLTIEIQSTSTAAALGISNLAIALGKLKENGSIGVANKNLKTLSDTLKSFTTVSSNANKVSQLAKALGDLKAVGSISVGTGIQNLVTGLRGLSTVQVDSGLETKIGKIADSLKQLSEVRNSGFSAVVKSLSQIGSITNSLDDATITAFESKIRRISDAVSPLSGRLTSLRQGLSGVNSTLRETGNEARDAAGDIDTASLNFSTLANVAQTLVQYLQQAIEKFTQIIEQSIEWEGISARFGRGFGTQAQETYDWLQRLNEEMGINVQQFMQYSSVYATMLTGFGVAVEDAGKMALGYTELTYDIWAGYNDIYKNFADAAEAVKSAIAGEVEPIRRAGFTIVEATLAETAANHGLEVSLYSATEAQKSYLRYLTLVDQAYDQGLVGTYAKELNTAEGLMRSFTQQLKTLAQSFGALFLPALSAVIPYLQAFVELLTDAVHWVARLFGIEIQTVPDWSGYETGTSAIGSVADSADTATDALGSAAKAAKELKNATLGIDELNVISPPTTTSTSGSTGSGGTGGTGGGFDNLGVGSLWDDSVFDMIDSQVDGIKAKLKGFFDWLAGPWKDVDLGPLTDSLKNLWEAVKRFSTEVLGEGLKWFYLEVLVPLGTWVIEDALPAFINMLADALNWFVDNKDGIAAVAISLGLFWGAWKTTSFITGILPTLTKAVEVFKAIFGVLSGSRAALSGLTFMFPTIMEGLSPVLTGLAALGGGSIVAGLGIVVAAIAAVVSVVYFLKKNWEEVTTAVQNFFNENIAPKLEEIKGHFENVKEALGPVGDAFEWLGEQAQKVVEWFQEFGGVAKIFEVVGGVIFSVIGGTISTGFNILVGLIENAIQVFSGITQVVSGIVEFVVALFTGGDIGAAWQNIWDGVVDVVSGIWGLLTQPFKDFWDGIIGWFTNLWDELVGHSIVPDTVNDIVEWFADMPGMVLDAIEGFYHDIIGWFDGLWDEITGWFKSTFDVAGEVSKKWEEAKNWWNNSKTALNSYTPDIGSIKEKLSSAWSKAKEWWDKTKGVLSTYTPTIGSIKDKVSDAWTKAKEWWNDSKGVLSTYTPTIGSIKDKVSSAWNTAKDWWNEHKGTLSYTPSIGSIKEKLSNAWTTAKNWWNDTRSGLSFTPTVGSIKDKLKEKWDTAKEWFNNQSLKMNIKTPHFSFGWDYDIGTVTSTICNFLFGKKAKPYISVSWYAGGGFPGMGELFVAREAGPEMVGRIGGRTAVANNEQIVEAISEGVYAAVLAAMGSSSGSNGDQAINIYLDGKQITASVEKRQKERGAAIMGTQIYSYA